MARVTKDPIHLLPPPAVIGLRGMGLLGAPVAIGTLQGAVQRGDRDAVVCQWSEDYQWAKEA